MLLAAIFEIESGQEKWFRDRLPRLADEINHGGLQIYVTPEPAAASAAAPELAKAEAVEPPPVMEPADEIEQEPAAETQFANSGAREEMSGDSVIVPQGE